MGIADSAFYSVSGAIGLTGCVGRPDRSSVPVRPVGWGGSTGPVGASADLTFHTLLSRNHVSVELLVPLLLKFLLSLLLKPQVLQLPFLGTSQPRRTPPWLKVLF
jgi:hypothetical protein